LWTLDRKILKAQKLRTEWSKDLAAYQVLMHGAWNEAVKRFLSEINDAKGTPITSWRELTDVWINVATPTVTPPASLYHASGIQLLTSRGISVADVDYAGSTGYGRAYREALRGTWGVADVDDCIAAARFLVDRGDVDGERLAIAGGSAGGYTTLAALAFRDDFAAGISEYGVGDLEALARDTHKFESRYLDRLIGPYPEAAAVYRQRSPVHFLDEIACPVLVLQGLDDKVVPPAQAEAVVAALAANGVPHAYLAFAGEGHGFRGADAIRRSTEAKLSFLAAVFGFTRPDETEPLEVSGLDAWRARHAARTTSG
jgi:dienelactone hydrolase